MPTECLNPRRAGILEALRAKRQWARATARRGQHFEAQVLQEQVVVEFEVEFEVEFGNADVDTLEAMSDLVYT